MACRLFSAKPLSKPMLPYFQLDPKEHISVTFRLKFKSFIQENALENIVCEMEAILSQPHSVKISASTLKSKFGCHPCMGFECKGVCDFLPVHLQQEKETMIETNMSAFIQRYIQLYDIHRSNRESLSVTEDNSSQCNGTQIEQSHLDYILMA